MTFSASAKSSELVFFEASDGIVDKVPDDLPREFGILPQHFSEAKDEGHLNRALFGIPVVDEPCNDMVLIA